MADSDQEAQWRKQFEANGRDAVLTLCHDGSYQGPMRLAAFQWLREKEITREARDEGAQWYLKWTFRAAVIVGIITVIVGIIGVLAGRYWH